MGTNFYWRYNVCSCCQRYDEVHVGKSATLHGVFDERYEDGRGYVDVPVVTSWAQWKKVLRGEVTLPAHSSGDGELWDEYGVKTDVEEFIAGREAMAPELRRRQFDWVRDHAHERPLRPGQVGKVGRDCDWLDADGFSFYGGGFS